LKIQTRVFSLLLGLVGFAGAPAVLSQTTAPAQVEQAASPYSDAELKSFAVALVEVHRINDSYTQKLASAQSPEEQQQIRDTASKEMVRAVETEGMSVEKYKEILSQAQNNPAVAERVKEHIRSSGK